MKVVILAGGLGTRLGEETQKIPKPMVEIGGKPIIWHIMKHYSAYGYHDFIICCGYKQHVIKQYFADYYLYSNDVTFDFGQENRMTVHQNSAEPWKVTLVDTGLQTMTGGRVRRIRRYIGEEPFMLTYGDGVADIDVEKLEAFHRAHGKTATMTAVQPEGRFGVLDIKDGSVRAFREKAKSDAGWVNGGFMVFQPEIFSYLSGDETVLEREPLERLAAEGQLMAYRHDGFWKCMDTPRDKKQLEDIWESGSVPWGKRE